MKSATAEGVAGGAGMGKIKVRAVLDANNTDGAAGWECWDGRLPRLRWDLYKLH